MYELLLKARFWFGKEYTRWQVATAQRSDLSNDTLWKKVQIVGVENPRCVGLIAFPTGTLSPPTLVRYCGDSRFTLLRVERCTLETRTKRYDSSTLLGVEEITRGMIFLLAIFDFALESHTVVLFQSQIKISFSVSAADCLLLYRLYTHPTNKRHDKAYREA